MENIEKKLDIIIELLEHVQVLDDLVQELVELKRKEFQ